MSDKVEARETIQSLRHTYPLSKHPIIRQKATARPVHCPKAPLISMSLTLPRRALWGVGLMLCVWAPFARAQNATDGTAPAPTDVSPIPVPDGPEEMTRAATAPAATAGASPAAKTLSPDEKRRQTENKLRALMKNLGIASANTQDAILEYLTADEMAHATLREAEKSLMNGLRRDVPPERMRDLLSDYRASVETDKTNRETEQRRLDVRVGYTLDPKLEATLWLMGVLGDGASKLPTGALVLPKSLAPATPDETPVYGPMPTPNFAARGEIVGTVMAKGVEDNGAHWLEIRDDSGALERYSAPWRDDLKAPSPDIEKQLTDTALSARIRVQWVWQEHRRVLQLKSEDAPQTVTNVPTP